MGLEDVKDWLHYCGRCNSCKYLYRDYRSSCPAFEKFIWECYTSSGKVWMARDLYDKKYPWSESVRDKIFSCTLCGNCTIQCQQEISDHALDIFEALREECSDRGLLKPEHKIFADNVARFNNPYGENPEKRFENIDSKYFKEKAEILFFVGCTTAFRNKQLLQDVLDILDYLGADVTLSKEEWCCGSPLLTTGQKKKAQALADHNVDIIKKLGVKIVLTACAGCYRSLKGQYPKKFNLLNGNQDPKVMHLSEYLANALKKKHLKSSDQKIRVTYHDPCHLGRHMQIFEEPRKILKLLKNVELVEMPRNRDNAWCCGAGAGVKSGFKDWATEIAEDRVIEALGLSKDGKGNIDYLVTTCPFCERNLQDGLNSLIQKQIEAAADMEIIDLIQLIKKYIQ